MAADRNGEKTTVPSSAGFSSASPDWLAGFADLLPAAE